MERLYEMLSNDPPAEPEAFRLLAPQRGLIATVQSQNHKLQAVMLKSRSCVELVNSTPGFVKLLLPPRQSRGVSRRTSLELRP